MKIYKYTYDFLITFCSDNNISLLGDDYNIKKINRDTIIKGNCTNNNCSSIFQKTFINLVKYGGFCKICARQKAKQTFKETCLTKYGVKNVFQLEAVKHKIIKTNLEKYSVTNPNYSKEILIKKENNSLKKYGVPTPLLLKEIKDKRLNACLNKYGTQYVLQSKLGQQKFKETCLLKFGYENPKQNEHIADKAAINSYKHKNYMFPSGKTIRYQGYENYALDILLNQEKINENDIIMGCKNVPNIWYITINSGIEKKHRHYVDIFIPSQNRCIEVKSTWTANKNKNTIFLKQQAGKKLGYIYEIWIFDKKLTLQKYS